MPTARPVALSLFPDVRPDRPVGPLTPSVQTSRHNGDLIAAIAPLYLEGLTVLDATYGEGHWWTRYRPAELIAHDLELDAVDFRQLPEADRSVDVVAFDPPYLPQGGDGSAGAKIPAFRSRFGLAPRSRAELLELHDAGLAEAARVARRWVLAKCCDYVDVSACTTSSSTHPGPVPVAIGPSRSAGPAGVTRSSSSSRSPVGPPPKESEEPLAAARYSRYTGYMPATTSATHRLLGVNGDADTCTACGRRNLVRVAWLAELDADGNTAGDAAPYGTDCAGRILLGAKNAKNTSLVRNRGEAMAAAARDLAAGTAAEVVARRVWDRFGYSVEARGDAVRFRFGGIDTLVAA